MSNLLERCLVLTYKTDSTGVKMAYGPWEGVAPGFEDIVADIEQRRSARALALMVNILPPKVHVPRHVDSSPNNLRLERWHYPVQTNPLAWVWQERDGYVHFPLSEWNMVRYWEPHAIGNDGAIDRIHIIVTLGRVYGSSD